MCRSNAPPRAAAEAWPSAIVADFPALRTAIKKPEAIAAKRLTDQLAGLTYNTATWDLGICNVIGTASERILVILVLAILTSPAQARQTEQARTQFECAITKVIITNKAGQTGSVQVEEHVTFWIDDAAKTFIFSDGQLLRISRFDKS